MLGSDANRPNRSVRFRWLLPGIYIIAAFTLVIGLGGVGHGWGIQAFYYLSLPAAVLAERNGMPVLATLLLGLAQYILVGYAVDVVRRKRPGQNSS